MTTESHVFEPRSGRVLPEIRGAKLAIKRDSTTINQSFFWTRAIISALRLAPHILLMMGVKHQDFKADLHRWSHVYYEATPKS